MNELKIVNESEYTGEETSPAITFVNSEDGGRIVFAGNVAEYGKINNQEKSVEITESGVTEIVPDKGYTGLSKVSVDCKTEKNTVEYLDLSGIDDYEIRQGIAYCVALWVKDALGLTMGPVNSIQYPGAISVDFSYPIKYGWQDLLSWFMDEYAIDIMSLPRITKEEFFHITSIDDIPDTKKLYYTASEQKQLSEPFVSEFWDSSTGEGVLVCADDITSIVDYLFSYFRSLTSVTIPNSVTSIGKNAFEKCESLTNITIPESVTSIGEKAFFDCTSLMSVNIPDGVTSIGNNAFDTCTSLKNVHISDILAWCKISFGGGSANPLCNEAKLYLNGSELTDITIPSDITEIKQYAFFCSSLISVVIPNSVTSIGNSAFSACTSLTNVTIGNSVTDIGNYAFSNCDSLKKVYCKPTTPPSGGSGDVFLNVTDMTIYVPRASVNAYKSAWSAYANNIVGYTFLD